MVLEESRVYFDAWERVEKVWFESLSLLFGGEWGVSRVGRVNRERFPPELEWMRISVVYTWIYLAYFQMSTQINWR